ncbi:MAG: ATP synthase F1 subunit delta [Faecalibacterium sp.]
MTQVAKMYGGSLYDLAAEENIAEEIRTELDAVCGLLAENPTYQHLLCLPNIPKKERCALLEEAFGGNIQPYLLNFLKILCENGTFSELKGCAQEYHNRYNEAHGILVAVATAAQPLTEAETEALRASLAEKTGKQIELSVTIDPACLGGLRVDVEGTAFDGTVKGRLARMQKSLAAIQL